MAKTGQGNVKSNAGAHPSQPLNDMTPERADKILKLCLHCYDDHLEPLDLKYRLRWRSISPARARTFMICTEPCRSRKATC
jgi:hypothetical protein